MMDRQLAFTTAAAVGPALYSIHAGRPDAGRRELVRAGLITAAVGLGLSLAASSPAPLVAAGVTFVALAGGQIVARAI